MTTTTTTNGKHAPAEPDVAPPALDADGAGALDHAARVQSMMDNAPTNMMFADKDLVVRYMNPASLRTLRSIEQHLPCRADDVVGSNIDIFHKNPVHQRTILADPDSYLPMTSQIQVGPEILELLVSKITDADGEHIGAMASWQVITEKVAAERFTPAPSSAG
jgi:methyl-accepting chemotaxis protein